MNPIRRWSLFAAWAACLLAGPRAPGSALDYHALDQPPHDYWQQTPRDRFTRLKDDLESGRIALDRSNEKAFVESLLQVLGIPASSQLLLFSTTSLQIRLISPSNPRALYFRDDTYLGYIPRGRIEVISIDPELGAIFHIFDIAGPGEPIRIERSDRCMNCHAGPETGHIPGLLMESVMPGPNGGSLESFRNETTGQGHGVPLAVRFGGWYLTGRHGLTQHWGNQTGRLFQGDLTTTRVEPGSRFDAGRYPAGASSDVVAHLVHEHQAGFVNRVVEAGYRARTYLHAQAGQLSPEHALELDRQARSLVRYILFADEVPLPPGVEADPQFRSDFLRDRIATPDGRSLRDFNLRSRIFEHRCSYLIYSPLVQSLPTPMRDRLFQALREALASKPAQAEYTYLSDSEKAAIREILGATVPGFDPDSSRPTPTPASP